MESKKINQLATELAPDLSDLTIIGDPTTGISKKITLSQMASLFTGTVEEYANFAAFPLVGVADTIYIAKDTNVIYRWDSTAYVVLSPNIIASLVFNDANGFDGTIALIGSVATLTITTALTSGSVPFIGASGALTQDNSNLFFDDTNNRLGIATASPTTALDVFGSGIIGRINGTSTNNAYLGFSSAGTNKWSVGNVQSDHRFRIFSEANSAELITILQTGEFGIGIANPTTKFHIDGAASALIANLDANVSVAKSISFRSDNSNRINLEVSGTESGSNAGANFFIRRYSDAGSLIDTPLTITRSTGAISLATTLNLSEIQATTSAGITLKSNGGTSVALFGAGGGAGVSLYGGLIGTSGTFSGAITAVGYSKFWDGTQGLNIGALSIGSGYGAIYSSNVTPSSTNYALISNGSTTYINGTSSVGLAISDSTKVLLNSAGNFGIGTITPNYTLHIDSNTSTTRFQITNSTTGQGGSVGFQLLQIANDTILTNRSNGYMSFETVGTERLKISSTGNIGIGVTPSSIYLSSQALEITKAGNGLWSYGQDNIYLTSNAYYTIAGAFAYGGTGKASAFQQDGGAFAWKLAGSGTAGGAITFNQAMTLTNGGALYINTTSALPGSGTLLHVDSPTAGPSFKNAASGQQTLMLWNAVSSGDNLFLEFNVNTSIVGKGSVDYNRASNVTRYNTTSDANLKNIIGDSNKQKSIDILNTTKIKEYSWKEDETNKSQIGVIAQELYKTFKGAVSVGSDEELLGTEDYKSWKVDKTAFTFHLIAGWQKHEEIISNLEKRIQQLESK
jgi:hypothetical protein